jgi:hypothetical protein
MANALLYFGTIWIKAAPCAEECGGCGDPIYSDTHELHLCVNGEMKEEVLLKVCASCYEIIKCDV